MTNETKQTAVEQLFIEMLEIQQSGKTLAFDENVELLNKDDEKNINITLNSPNINITFNSPNKLSIN